MKGAKHTERRPGTSTALAVALAAAAVAPALTGCADEPAARAADRRVTIVLDDFRYKPQTVRARAGKLTVTLISHARLGHNFTLRKGGQPVRKISPIKPGARVTETLDLKRGDYRIFCSIANHEELGMYGTLTVR
jgi:plastocyanin